MSGLASEYAEPRGTGGEGDGSGDLLGYCTVEGKKEVSFKFTNCPILNNQFLFLFQTLSAHHRTSHSGLLHYGTTEGQR